MMRSIEDDRTHVHIDAIKRECHNGRFSGRGVSEEFMTVFIPFENEEFIGFQVELTVQLHASILPTILWDAHFLKL